MAKINKAEVIQKLIDQLELSPATDLIPTEIADKILPTFQVNTEEITVSPTTANIVRSQVQLNAGTTTIYTTPSTGKFYLTNVALQMIINTAAAVSGNCDVSITIDGITQKIAYLRGNGAAGTIETTMNNINLQNPVLIDPGTNITITTSENTIDAYCSIVGYTTSA